MQMLRQPAPACGDVLTPAAGAHTQVLVRRESVIARATIPTRVFFVLEGKVRTTALPAQLSKSSDHLQPAQRK
jgi:hypothetical protein